MYNGFLRSGLSVPNLSNDSAYVILLNGYGETSKSVYVLKDHTSMVLSH